MMIGVSAVSALAVAAILVLAPLAAWLGRRYGRSVKGGLVLGSILLGFREALDPPSKRAIEAATDEADRKEPPAPGEPPLDCS
jgi:hypothetical protein